MSKAWMPLYIGDYMADTGHLSTAEHGCYLLLIMHYWENGSIPVEDDKLARICRCRPQDWSRHYKSTVLAFFQSSPSTGHPQVHLRIDAELRRLSEISSKRKGAAVQMHSKRHASASVLQPVCTTQSQSHLDLRKKEDSCRIADAIPTMQATKKSGKPRLAYDSGFDVFWAAYPTTRNMSKKEAWDVWRRLPAEDRQLAIDAVPKYAEWLKGKGEKAPETIHACRFLSKRRFEGHAQAPVNISPNQFYAAFGSQELEAWDAYARMTRGRDYPKDKRGGWSFPSRWPPKLDQAEA